MSQFLKILTPSQNALFFERASKCINYIYIYIYIVNHHLTFGQVQVSHTLLLILLGFCCTYVHHIQMFLKGSYSCVFWSLYGAYIQNEISEPSIRGKILSLLFLWDSAMAIQHNLVKYQMLPLKLLEPKTLFKSHGKRYVVENCISQVVDCLGELGSLSSTHCISIQTLSLSLAQHNEIAFPL